jgi:hypothetical protein
MIFINTDIMWDLSTLSKLNDDEVKRRQRKAETKEGAILQSWGTPRPKKLVDILKEKVAHVNLHGEWLPLADVDFIDISEDLFGEDVVSYRHNGELHTSKVVLR